MNTLTIKRFNGQEIFNVAKLKMNFKELINGVYLHIEVSTDKAMHTLEDTAPLKALPNAEILLKVESPDEHLLVDRRFVLERSYDNDTEEHLSIFYYMEHQDLDNNDLSISRIEGDRYIVVWQATTTDVNYYDSSKPESIIIIEAEGSFS